jgi:hypothetical protein
MPSIDVATMKVRKTTAVKIKTLAAELGISQLDLLDKLVDSIGGAAIVKKQAPTPAVVPEDFVIKHFNNKLWSMYFKEQPDELKLYMSYDELEDVADIYSKPYKIATEKLIAHFTSKNKNVTLDTLHSDSLKINKE